MDIYERISYKAHEEINNLTQDERLKAEELAINDIRHLSDEQLLQYLIDRGLIL